jgi:hypothetical protein
VWDLRQPRPTLSLAAHAYEVLAADWCKYNDCVIATGSVDKSIKASWGFVCVCNMFALECGMRQALLHCGAGLCTPLAAGLLSSYHANEQAQ